MRIVSVMRSVKWRRPPAYGAAKTEAGSKVVERRDQRVRLRFEDVVGMGAGQLDGQGVGKRQRRRQQS